MESKIEYSFVSEKDSDSVKIAALKTMAIEQVTQRDKLLIESYDKADVLLKPMGKKTKVESVKETESVKGAESVKETESEESEEKPAIVQRAKRFTKRPAITLDKSEKSVKDTAKPLTEEEKRAKLFSYLDSLTHSEVYSQLDSGELSSELWKAWKDSKQASKPAQSKTKITIKGTEKPTKKPFDKSDVLTQEALDHYLTITDKSLLDKYDWLEDLIDDLRDVYSEKIGINKCQSIWANACKSIKETLGVNCNPRPTLEECVLSIEEWK